MKKTQKAQITLFIILGLVLFVILGFVLIITGTIKIGSPNNEDVKSFTEDCLKIAETCMLERAGENGAYSTFNYGLNPLENAKTELENIMGQAAEICQNGFSDFKGVQIDAQTPDVKASFNKDDTTATMSQEIKIEEKDKTTTINEFTSQIPVRFSEAYSLSSKLMEDDKYVDADLLENNEFSINVYEAEDNQLFVMTDELSTIKGTTNYKFSFLRNCFKIKCLN